MNIKKYETNSRLALTLLVPGGGGGGGDSARMVSLS